MPIKLRILLLAFIVIQSSLFSQEIIKTSDGSIEGYKEGNIRIFKGIPFASPPVGSLRWRAPQPVKPWKE
jgi:para-nitrobenzyl esterase